MAILNYEKAKKLSPSDDDINYNLKLANTKLVDKIEALPQLFIKDWWNNFLLLFSERAWSVICIAFTWLCFIGLVVFFLPRSRAVKQMGFTIAVLSLFLSIGFFFVSQKSSRLNSAHSDAIEINPSVSIKGSPSDQGTNLFILHDGTKVNIEQSNGDWVEIKISNGNRGWIKTCDIAII